MTGKRLVSVLLIAVLIVTAFYVNGIFDKSNVNATPETIITTYNEIATTSDEIIIIEDENVPLAQSPLRMPVASGTDVRRNANVEIDVSNMSDGYVMVRYLGRGSSNLRVLITGPNNVTYTYRLRNDGNFEVFPLSVGNGRYTVGVFRNVSGNQFSTLHSININVTLTDEFAPFLRPNQFVNFNANTLAVRHAAELIQPNDTTLQKVARIYSFVINNFTYDEQLARTVQSGYVPDLDRVWRARQGICFDYAAITTAMLRSQGIPTRLVIGYVGELFHAWISVWTEESGWVEGVIYFDGRSWRLMDPTFAAGANASQTIMRFIGTGNNHSPRFFH